jgi:RimJ/RimL family protein N-acetyltransferase
MSTDRQTVLLKLNTERLVLRSLEQTDVPVMHTLCNDPNVSATIADMPYPYPIEAAVGTVEAMQHLMTSGEAYAFAIVPHDSNELVGIVYLIPNPAYQHAELIYWLGKPHWGKGYATEAARAVLTFAFGQLKFHRVYASVFRGNTASAHILEKCGMQSEGTQRGHILKNGKFVDLLSYGLLSSEFNAVK